MKSSYLSSPKIPKGLLSALAFLASFIVLVFLFPKEGKFRYEYQLFTPWLHENLIAPYDFPINKLPEELAAERDSISRNKRPYFLRDEALGRAKVEDLRSDFGKKWQEALDALAADDPKAAEKAFPEARGAELAQALSDFMGQLYSVGVIGPVEQHLPDWKPGIPVVVLKDNIAQSVTFEELYTVEEAYAEILADIDLFFAKDTGSRVFFLLKSINYYEFIKPNLLFDQATTQREFQGQLESISLTSGLVVEGQKIVLTGEIVDLEVFRILESLKARYETELGLGSTFGMILLGHSIMVALALALLLGFLLEYHRESFHNFKHAAFLLSMMVGFVAVGSMVINKDFFSLFLVPFAILPIIVRTFFTVNMAFILHSLTVLLVGFMAPNGFEFVFMQFTVGYVALFSMSNSYKRGRLFAAAAATVVAYALVFLAISLVQQGEWANIQWPAMLWFLGNGLLMLSSYPLIYLFEKAFGFLSELTLVELSDYNQPLLRRMAQEAPGTFQHSMQVANLAEHATREIGGNALLVRAGALYHDIGKMANPLFFTENQQQGVNPHDKLEFDESAQIIIEHVSKGVEMAQREKLPEAIVQFIRTHHGTSKVLFFYRSFRNKHPDKEIDIEKFSYKGPRPFSKETAVLMMADSVEAASKSLRVFNEDSLTELIENIINAQIKEGQFDMADITFKDITTVKAVFLEKLQSIYRSRIAYPEEKKSKAE